MGDTPFLALFPWLPMTLNQLRVFLTVVRLGSFSAAAVSLGMSQPSVSELIRRLEDTYGMRLFIRGSRRLTISSAGEALLPFAQKAVDAADSGDRALRSLTALTGGVAVFGLLRNANRYYLSQLLETFHERYPKVRLRTVGVNSVEVAEMVQRGELETGLVVLPIDVTGLVVTPLLRDEVLYVSANPSHTAAPVTMRDLADRNLVLYDAHYGWTDPTRRQIAERAQLAGITLHPLIEVEQVEAALGLVAHGAGDTFVARAVMRDAGFPSELSAVSFAEPLFDTVALVRREDTTPSPATRELARLARELLLQHAGSEGLTRVDS